MISADVVSEKLKETESPILEFKREWYWDDKTPSQDMGDKWGEFIKDLISISNAYMNKTSLDRYLIVGYCDTTDTIFGVDQSRIKHLANLRNFKKTLIEKLEGYTSPTLINFEVEFVHIAGKSLLVFRVSCPTSLTELKSGLKTKTRTLDPGAVLIRKGQENDSVRTASPSEIIQLKEEFDLYRKVAATARHEKKPTSLKERSIEKTVQLFIDKNSSFSLDVSFPVKKADWDENVVFELYRLSDSFGITRELLYLHESASQGKTLGYLKSNQLVRDYSRMVILTEQPNIKDAEKRKTNISSAFGTRFVYFIAEFGYEFLYKDCLLDYEKYNLPVFVDSLVVVQEGEERSAFKRLEEWYQRENEPLLVIKGYGGIGKTTLANAARQGERSEGG